MGFSDSAAWIVMVYAEPPDSAHGGYFNSEGERIE